MKSDISREKNQLLESVDCTGHVETQKSGLIVAKTQAHSY